jgi:GNAT superfamily N-acetyltransferase
MRTNVVPIALAGIFLLAGCGRQPVDYRAHAFHADPLHAAMQHLTGVIVHDIFSPPQAARAYAYASIAAYEAVRHDQPSAYLSLAGQLNGLQTVPEPDSADEHYLPLSGIHAFLTVGRALTFSQERMDSARAAVHEEFRSMGIPAAVVERSVAYGEQVAEHILAWVATDYFDQVRGYPKFSVTPEGGRWKPTPPAYMDAVEPNWARLRPFAMDSAAQFRPRPPLPYDTAASSPFFQQVQEVYEIRRGLTDEQREIATFWDCNPYHMHVRGHAMFATKKHTPGGHWMNIAALASRQVEADLVQAAEAYARTAIALADAFLSSWEEKYRSNLVRPETVINSYLDETWEPLLQTPPFPEYTSGHSVISTAAAVVLADLFGDDFAFDDTTELEYGLPVRSFSSFSAAAAEAAVSRLYGGIHYRMAVDEGVVQGRAVGENVIRRVRTRADNPLATMVRVGDR